MYSHGLMHRNLYSKTTRVAQRELIAMAKLRMTGFDFQGKATDWLKVSRQEVLCGHCSPCQPRQPAVALADVKRRTNCVEQAEGKPNDFILQHCYMSARRATQQN